MQGVLLERFAGTGTRFNILTDLGANNELSNNEKNHRSRLGQADQGAAL